MGRLAAFNPAVKTLDESVARAVAAERLGFESVWATQLPDARDAALVLAAYAKATKRVGLGTGVLPIYTRHPTAMVQMAATLDELSGGRFILGIGISHKVTVESMWGLRLDSPVDAMREYLEIVRMSLRDGGAGIEGKYFSAQWTYSGPRRPEMPVMISALNPRMLELAGEQADGVVLWMCSPAYIRDHVVPAVTAARTKVGKSMDGFEILAAVPVCLTTDRTCRRSVEEALQRGGKSREHQADIHGFLPAAGSSRQYRPSPGTDGKNQTDNPLVARFLYWAPWRNPGPAARDHLTQHPHGLLGQPAQHVTESNAYTPTRKVPAGEPTRHQPDVRNQVRCRLRRRDLTHPEHEEGASPPGSDACWRS